MGEFQDLNSFLVIHGSYWTLTDKLQESPSSKEGLYLPPGGRLSTCQGEPPGSRLSTCQGEPPGGRLSTCQGEPPGGRLSTCQGEPPRLPTCQGKPPLICPPQLSTNCSTTPGRVPFTLSLASPSAMGASPSSKAPSQVGLSQLLQLTSSD